MDQVSVYVCESHPVAVEGLARVLGLCADLELVGSSLTLRESLEAVRTLRPHVLLVDQTAGLKIVFQFLAEVRTASPASQAVLWVNDLAEIDCFRALQLGARGVLKKTLPVPSLLECLRSVASGNVWIENSLPERSLDAAERRGALRLTPREREIVHHICGGLKNREIADALSITPGTVKVHLMHIFEKTGVKDRFELAIHGRKLLGIDHSTQMARAEAHVEQALSPVLGG